MESPLSAQIQLRLLFGLHLALTAFAIEGVGPTAGCILTVVFASLWLHDKLSPGSDFNAELLDLTNRPVGQNVLVMGNWVQKSKLPRFFYRPGLLQEPGIRFGLGVGIWILAYFLFRGRVHLGLAFTLVAALCSWGLASTRLYQWTLILAINVLVVAMTVSQHVFTACSGALFLCYLLLRHSTLIRACRTNFDIQSDEFRLQAARVVGVFVVAFTAMTFLLPDQKFAETLSETKKKVARQLASRQMGRSGTPNGGSGGFASQKRPHRQTQGSDQQGTSDGQGHSNQQASSAQQGPTDPQASAGSGQSNSARAMSDATGDTDASTDSTGPGPAASDVRESKAHDIKLEIAKKKFEFRLEKLEQFTRFLLITLGLAALYSWFRRKPMLKQTDMEAQRRQRRRRNAAYHALKSFRHMSFPDRRSEVIAAYQTYLATLAGDGFVKPAEQTPLRFWLETKELSHPLAGPGEVLTNCFAQVYYGNQDLGNTEYADFTQAVTKLQRPFQFLA